MGKTGELAGDASKRIASRGAEPPTATDALSDGVDGIDTTLFSTQPLRSTQPWWVVIGVIRRGIVVGTEPYPQQSQCCAFHSDS